MELSTGMVTLAVADRTEIDLAAVPRAVRASGFVPDRMSLRARGHLEGEGDQALFRILNWKTTHPISRVPAGVSGEVVLHATVNHGPGSLSLEVIELRSS